MSIKFHKSILNGWCVGMAYIPRGGVAQEGSRCKFVIHLFVWYAVFEWGPHALKTFLR